MTECRRVADACHLHCTSGSRINLCSGFAAADNDHLRRCRRLANNTIGRSPPPFAASPVNIRPAGTDSRYFAVLRRCRAGAERGRVHPPADRRLPTAYPYTGLSLATVVTALSRPDLSARCSYRSNSAGPGTGGTPGHRTIAGCRQRPGRGATWGNRGGYRSRRARGLR